MSRHDKPSQDFNWAEAQRRYLDALAALGGSQGMEAASPWSKALEFWWQGSKALVPEDGRPMFGNLVQQSALFLGMAEQFSKLLSTVTSAEKDALDWQSELSRHLDALKACFNELGAGGVCSPQALMAALQPGLDTWQRTFSAVSMLPGDMFQAYRQPHVGEEAPQALGYTREWQEEFHEAARLWQECQKSMVDYRGGISRVGARAVDKLKERLIGLSGRDQKISSLRELYDLWIECAEQAYAEHVFTPEYAASYGRMVNALAAFKRHGQSAVDKALASMNMPTQQGVTTMQRRQQELRREMKQSADERRAQAEAIEELKKELEALRASQAAAKRKPAASPRGERRSTARKTPTGAGGDGERQS